MLEFSKRGNDMSKLKYPHLFEPIQIAGNLYRNRIFASPTGYLNRHDAHLTEGANYYYGRRAMGGAASVCTFECMVDGEYGAGSPIHLRTDDPSNEPGLGRVAHYISDFGAIPSIELTHAGMFANRALSMDGGNSWGPAFAPVDIQQEDRVVKGMDIDDINRTINKFIDGAAMAQKVGFKACLIHAGHGWGLHQFLSPLINTRTDEWGGESEENRCRMLNAIIDGIHARCGRNFMVEVRISGSECYDGGFGVDVGVANAKQIDGHADLIHVSAGNHEVDEVFTITHPSMFEIDGVNVYLAEAVKKEVETPVAAIGALSDAELMEEIIASGKADVVECAREFICDPDFPNKLRQGRDDEVRQCMRCLACFSNELTHGEPYCAINPQSGREIEAYYGFPPVKQTKKVLVVGGGVAGMEAALDASDRGHEVILCEKGKELGGVIRCERNVDFKHKLDRYLDQQQRRCFEDPNIDVRLNTEVTPEMAEAMDVDVIIAALGAEQMIPPIPGIDGDNVMNAVDAYNAASELGQKVVIMGAGLVGVELGLHLRKLGKDVVNVEMLDHMSDGGNFLHMSGVRVAIAKRGLEVNFKNKVKEVKPDGVLCETEDGEKFYEADSVIVAMGMRPHRAEAIALAPCAPEFYAIGDCEAVANIEKATTAAYFTAKNLGRF